MHDESPALRRKLRWVTIALAASIAAHVGGLIGEYALPVIVARVRSEELIHHRVLKSARSIELRAVSEMRCRRRSSSCSVKQSGAAFAGDADARGREARSAQPRSKVIEGFGSAPPLPERFGPFVLAKLIHLGGMGELFFARSSLDGYPVVVLKRLRPDLGGIVPLERFRHEAELAVRLQHPNVVQSLHVGEVESRRYLAFEPIVGRSAAQLSDRLLERRLTAPPRFVTRLMVEVLSALAYLHRASDESGAHLSLLHRDVTPGNVLIGYDGEVKLTDFGVARSLMSAGLGLTQPGTVVGTPAYVAPEFLRGEDLGPPVDIYGLGGVAYRLLTGQSPFPGTARVVVMKAMGQMPAPARELRPDAPPWLTELIDRMLAHDAAQRPQCAAELRDELSGVAESVGCLASSAQLGRWLSRHFEEEKALDEATMRAVALIDLESLDRAAGVTVVFASSGSAPTILPRIEGRHGRTVSAPVQAARAGAGAGAGAAQARQRRWRRDGCDRGSLGSRFSAAALGIGLGLAAAATKADARWESRGGVTSLGRGGAQSRGGVTSLGRGGAADGESVGRGAAALGTGRSRVRTRRVAALGSVPGGVSSGFSKRSDSGERGRRANENEMCGWSMWFSVGFPRFSIGRHCQLVRGDAICC